MFREMRRIKQLLSTEDVNAIMDRCTNGILACMGDEDYPYAVPERFNKSDMSDGSDWSDRSEGSAWVCNLGS